MNFTNLRNLKTVNIDPAKHTRGLAIFPLTLPEYVYIPMDQCYGTPCRPVVEVGDHVYLGQPVGSSFKKLASPIFASVSGEVTELREYKQADGTEDIMVVIKADGKQEPYPQLAPPKITSRDDYISAVRYSGVVGLGGAGYPTGAKYAYDENLTIDTFIVNGLECEPFVSVDYASMFAYPKEIILGIQSTLRWLNIKQAIIAIDQTMDDVEAAFNHVINTENISNIRVQKLPADYPMGSQSSLIYACTGKVLTKRRTPIELGILVSNALSVLKIREYIRTGMPLVSRPVTVDGDIVRKPANLEVPIGALPKDMLQNCGGLTEEPGKIVLGGPLMGTAAQGECDPITKTVNAVLFFGKRAAKENPKTPCIRCGRCVQKCPQNLMPLDIAKAYEKGDLEELKALSADSCNDCNICSFVCPARRNVADTVKKAKLLVLEAEGIKEGGDK